MIKNKIKIKICGITTKNVLETINNLKCDYAGFIFYPPSSRYILNNGDRHRALTTPTTTKKVAVFVNEQANTIKNYYQKYKFNIIQLHGDESPTFCNDLNLPFWKAIALKDENSIKMAGTYSCDTIIFDSFKKNSYGGDGELTELSLIKEALSINKNVIIAGGLNITNIEKILELAPYGVDINSGVERTKGNKDIEKIKVISAFIHQYNR